jgi:hypothetical protein
MPHTSMSESLIGILLDWCSNNGIRIHPNLSILHHHNLGISVRAAAKCLFTHNQSRKRLSLI